MHSDLNSTTFAICCVCPKLISVDSFGDVAILAGAEGAGRRNLLTIDVRHTKPGKLLAVNDSHDSIRGSRVLNITPRDLQVGTGGAVLVRPALGSSIASGHANNSTAISLTIVLDGKVVIASRVALTTVAGQIGNCPRFVKLGRIRSCTASSRGLTSGCGCKSGQSQGTVGGDAAYAIRVAMGRIAGIGSGSRRCRSGQSQGAIGGDAAYAIRVAMGRVASIGSGRSSRCERAKTSGQSKGVLGDHFGISKVNM